MSEWDHLRLLTTVHLITSIFTVDHLVTAAVVGDAASVFALELSYFAQGHCRRHKSFLMNRWEANTTSSLSQLYNHTLVKERIIRLMNPLCLSSLSSDNFNVQTRQFNQ